MTVPAMPDASKQADRLIELGVHEIANIAASELRAAGDHSTGLLVLQPTLAPASALAPLLTRRGKSGFVVVDMPDVDQFDAINEVTLPDSPIYSLHDVQRGDSMANWSPDEALPAIVESQRTPLLLTEGIFWLLQQPEALERNHCFMTIGSRLRKSAGKMDSRTPAVWISNGTGRDGKGNREAPKVGWCWAGNRHTWLGFASAANRQSLDTRDQGRR